MRRWLVAILVLPGLAGCLGDDKAPSGAAEAVTITWTEHGIPHVRAASWHGLGLGAGFAAAEDNLCMLAEEYVTVSGERSKWFGPGGSYRLTSNGQAYTNRQSDVFWKVFHDPDRVQSSARWDDPRAAAALEGFVAGYNRYLADIPEGRHLDCRDAPWLRPITMDDMVARVNKLQLLGSSLFFAPYMVDASPLPGFSPDVPPGRLPTPEGLGFGSNGYAFGQAATGGAGLLLGNPHFSWHGPERFSQLHLTIPGELDVMGMTLLGVPIVLIGFNEHVAWTHTVSTAWRFTAYELKLVPGSPTSYLFDGQVRTMDEVVVDIEVDARGTTEQHSIFFSHYGPIIEFPLAGAVGINLPDPLGAEAGLTWTAATAYTIRDVNADNDRITEQFLRFNRATGLDDLVASLDEVGGVPWVNTIAASPDGRAFYADISATPNVPDALWDACNTAVGIPLTAAARLPVLDGSTSACDWVDGGGPQAGMLPPREMPRTIRQDWVINSNDSHWLPNPAQPLEGYSRMIGDERTERSQRTRMGYVLIDERLGGDADCAIDAGAPCDQMTLLRLQHALFSSRLHAAETSVDDLIAETCTVGSAIASDGTVVDLDTPCKVLDTWDRTADLDARGLALFERFWLRAPKTWAVPFDADDPVATPNDYVGTDPLAVRALADAVRDLQRAGIPVDAPVRDVRVSLRDGEAIPLHGAHGALGSPSMMTFPWTATGWGEVEHGNSYIQTVTWDDGVHAEAVLTYSQSSDPTSPYSADQTRLYSQKQWVRLPFTTDEIEAATVRTLTL